MAIVVVIALVPLLGACVYRMNIQQGNFLESSTVDQLQVGMTRSQVRYLLGTPMVPDAFNKDRWDYLYSLRKGRLEKQEKRRLTVYFEEEKVARFERLDNGVKSPSSSAEAPKEPAVPPKVES